MPLTAVSNNSSLQKINAEVVADDPAVATTGDGVTTSWRDVLPIHPAASKIPDPTEEEKRALAADLSCHGQRTPVTLVRVASNPDPRPQLADGRTRCDLQEAADVQVVDANGQLLIPHVLVEVRDDAEAEALSLSLNVHRRHLSGEARRRLIAELIKADPGKSDRQVAGELGASPTTVGTVRAEMEAKGAVSKMDTRRDHRGHRQAAHKSTKARNSAGKATAHKTDLRSDIGADNRGELERLRVRCGELENVLQREKTRSLGLESEVADLREAAAEAQQKLNADLTDAELAETLARATLKQLLAAMPTDWARQLEERVSEHLSAPRLLYLLEHRFERDGVNAFDLLRKLRDRIDRKPSKTIDLKALPVAGEA